MNVAQLVTPKNALKLMLFAGAFGCLYVIFSAMQNEDAGPPAPSVDGFQLTQAATKAPATPLTAPDGETRLLSDYQGDVLLVNVWATWCAPCVEEMPALDRLQGAFSDAPFRVVPVSIDGKGLSVAQPFLERHGVENFKTYADPRAMFAFAAGADSVVPTTILYDAQGREVGRLVGPAEWDGPAARRLIERALQSSAN